MRFLLSLSFGSVKNNNKLDYCKCTLWYELVYRTTWAEPSSAALAQGQKGWKLPLCRCSQRRANGQARLPNSSVCTIAVTNVMWRLWTHIISSAGLPSMRSVYHLPLSAKPWPSSWALACSSSQIPPRSLALLQAISQSRAVSTRRLRGQQSHSRSVLVSL